MKKVIGLVLAVLLAQGVSAAVPAKYVDVMVDLYTEGESFQNEATAVVGKAVRVTRISDGLSFRLDYTIDSIGLSESGQHIAVVSGMAFKGHYGSPWSLVNDFKVVVELGKPASISVRNARYQSDIQLQVDLLTEAELTARFDGKLPEATVCPETTSVGQSCALLREL